MNTNANHDLINDAKRCAREAIHEAWPAAKEVSRSTAGMYEFDAILIDDEACSIASVSIMHDPDVNTFALVEDTRPVTPLQDDEIERMPTFNFEGPIDWDKLAEDHAIAYLRGDLATSSPESYTIDEMREISEAMDTSTAEVEAALRTDFEVLPPEFQGKLLDMLCASGCMTPGWWRDVLVGATPESPSLIAR